MIELSTGLDPLVLNARPSDQNGELEVEEPLQALDIQCIHFPPSYYKNWVCECEAIELFQCRKQMVLYARQERIGCAIENLNWCRIPSECPMPNEKIDSFSVVHY